MSATAIIPTPSTVEAVTPPASVPATPSIPVIPLPVLTLAKRILRVASLPHGLATVADIPQTDRERIAGAVGAMIKPDGKKKASPASALLACAGRIPADLSPLLAAPLIKDDPAHNLASVYAVEAGRMVKGAAAIVRAVRAIQK